ncbi:MAG: response regulator transcription factor [Bacillota bacterium]|nr:response regulator transcription factor [Bacillota bacterium]
MEKILVVEDERPIAEVVKAYLEGEGFAVTVVYDGTAALAAARHWRPDLIVLDLMLPGLSGEEVCRKLRSESDVPILMLTAKSEEEDRVQGLQMGADDYLVKPFSPRELVARVRAILRRTRGGEVPLAEVLSFNGGELVLDTARHQVWLGGREVNLTPTEFKLLTVLSRYPGRVLTRSQLTQQVQGYDYEGYDRTIDVHIKNLRQKIEPEPENPRYIKTVYGVGYKFEGQSDGV